MITPDFDGIPAELKERRQYVVWKNKIPIQPNGAPARVNDPSTWSTFDEVVGAYKRGGYDGIGYVFSADDPFCGIDLDGCRHPIDGVDDWAREIIDRLGSYAEVSPSGSGVHILIRGRSPFPNGRKIALPRYGGEGGKEAGIEIYDHGRYFCVTGHRVLRRNNP